MADPLLLDTSALLAFIEDEPGADQVEAALLDAGRVIGYGCFGGGKRDRCASYGRSGRPG